jgi:hypothetical protein
MCLPDSNTACYKVSRYRLDKNAMKSGDMVNIFVTILQIFNLDLSYIFFKCLLKVLIHKVAAVLDKIPFVLRTVQNSVLW